MGEGREQKAEKLHPLTPECCFVRKQFLLRDVTSSSVISNLNRAGHAGVGGQIMRLQALLKKEVATSSIIQEGTTCTLTFIYEQSCVARREC